MAFADLLINTCTILEDTGATLNDYGTLTPSWTPVTGLVNIPCRLVTSSGREIKVGAEVIVANYVLFLNNITVTEQNRVRISSIDYEILLVSNRQYGFGNHHKECFLAVVR